MSKRNWCGFKPQDVVEYASEGRKYMAVVADYPGKVAPGCVPIYQEPEGRLITVPADSLTLKNPGKRRG